MIADSFEARIGVVDDHASFRQVLCHVIAQMDDVTVCWEAGDVGHALQQLEQQRVDLVVADLSLPGASGIDLVRHLTAEHDDVVSIVVSGHTDRAFIDASFRAGAAAFVLKGRPGELRAGIRAALAGDRYLSSGLSSSDLPAG